MSTKIPQNQLDALPILTESSVGQPDEVFVVGDVVTQKWNPTSVGINNFPANAGDPRGGGAGGYAMSNVLNFTGMKYFTACLGCRLSGVAGDGLINWTLYIIPQAFTADGEVVPLPGGPAANQLTGFYGSSAFAPVGVLQTPALTGLPLPAFPHYKMASCSWDLGVLAGGSSLTAGALGPSRLWMSNSGGANNQTFSLTVWASTG